MALAAAFAEWDAPSTSAQGAKRYHDLAMAHEILRTYLHPRDITLQNIKPDEPGELAQAIHILREADELDMVVQDFLDQAQGQFYLVTREARVLMAEVWAVLQEGSGAPGGMSQPPNADASEMPDGASERRFELKFTAFLSRMMFWLRAWGRPVDLLENRLKAVPDYFFHRKRYIVQFTTLFNVLLHAALPATFPICLDAYLSLSLRTFQRQKADPATPADAAGRFSMPSADLHRLNIFPRYTSTLTHVAYGEIRRIVQAETGHGWQLRRLPEARYKVAESIAPWLNHLYERTDGSQNLLKAMFSRFDWYICHCLFEMWTDKIFEIIVDYPDSLPALEDLKKVVERESLVKKLMTANANRLLHAGAETQDVITQYISTIKCLRILDPIGAILHQVAEPIRHHLRSRPDTIKRIVASLVEGEELQDESGAPGGLISEANDEAVEDFSNPKWDPEPIDAAPEFRSGKGGDITSTLVSIYETREGIVKELQTLLAARLLAVENYDAVAEIRTIELLKLRFGETALQVCDVMLKDMADSKRINDHIRGDIQTEVEPLIISRMFWPSVPPSALHLPPKLEQAQRAYEAAFHRFKPDKHLRWLQSLGTATIKLELADRIIEVEATPLQASVAELFEAQPTYTAHDLAEQLGDVDLGSVRHALAFWAEQGVVREEGGGVWRLLEYADGRV